MTWARTKTIRNNSKKSRAHVWFKPEKSVYGPRLKCTKYSKDDYFSIYVYLLK